MTFLHFDLDDLEMEKSLIGLHIFLAQPIDVIVYGNLHKNSHWSRYFQI